MFLELQLATNEYIDCIDQLIRLSFIVLVESARIDRIWAMIFASSSVISGVSGTDA
jgi:hypothetical protein